jgi:NTE family protein
VPFDLLSDCDLVVAVDVGGGPMGGRRALPTVTEAVFGSSQIFMRSITRQKLRAGRQPDILIEPPANAFRALDFMKTVAILEAAAPIKDQVKRRIDAHLSLPLPDTARLGLP